MSYSKTTRTVDRKAPLLSGRNLTVLLAALTGLAVLLITIRSQESVGAGIYYDDGAYLALGRALARGDGYTYSNLPGAVPGVKYPPAYPFVLASMWKLLDHYPENLGALKAMNAVLWGLAATGTFLLFARGGRRRRLAVAMVTVYAFLTVPSMSIATVLMAEPLFLVLSVAALLLAARAPRKTTEPPGLTGGMGWQLPGGSTSWALLTGLAAGLAFLTRSIGLTLILALLVPLILRRRWREAAFAAAAGGGPALAWLVWAGMRRGDVPGLLTGQYGSYGTWFGEGLIGGALGRFREIISANWYPFVDTLQFVWVPRAPLGALLVVLFAVGAATAYGLGTVWRRNPALALFPFAYLALVFVWPYEPYRFFYAIMPMLTLLALEGLWETVHRVREDLPRWGIPVAMMAALVFGVNALVYHGRGHALRSWAVPQTIPAKAYAPLNAWIRANTSPDEVIASALDPYVHWETGRLAVPSWRFLADDYGRYDRTPEVLSAALDSVINRYGVRYVALILGENKAARTLEAFVGLHPERALRLVETEGPPVGVIYAVAPPGVALWDPDADPAEEDPEL